ncbi:MAG: HEAT repeat domain-containing protein [Planctomycetes bacterium]|nr:HEAT repeat domain-containing protein [Planctomycetota bacterium]
MRALLIIVCFLGAACAQDRPWLCTALLDKCDVVVQARWISDRLVSSSVQVTCFKVEQTFKGEAVAEIRVGGLGRRGKAYTELPKLLFLKGEARSSVYAAVDLVDLTADDAVVAPVLVESTLRLAALDAGAARDLALRELAITGMRSNCAFALRSSLRELQRLTGKRGEFLQWEDVGIVRRAGGSLPVEDRALAQHVAERIAANLLGTCAGAELAVREGEERDGLARAIVRIHRAPLRERIPALASLAERFAGKSRLALEGFLLHADTALRAEAAVLLGEHGSEQSVEKLQQVSAFAESAERHARIEAIGKLGGSDALDGLVALLPERDTLDATLTAIARLDCVGGRQILERVLSQIGSLPAEVNRVQLIQRLLSSQFREAEVLLRAARLARKGH